MKKEAVGDNYMKLGGLEGKIIGLKSGCIN